MPSTLEHPTSSAPCTPEPARTRRWRRIVARRAAPAAAPACPSAPAVAGAASAPREAPGFVAVAIARVLIAIDFALGHRG